MIGWAAAAFLLASGAWAADEGAPELRRKIQAIMIREVSSGKRVSLYIDLGGRSVRSRVLEAREQGLKVNASGMTASVAWDRVRPSRLASAARRLAASAEEVMLIARYCRACGLQEEAEEALAAAIARDPSYAKFRREIAPKPPAVRRRVPSRPATAVRGPSTRAPLPKPEYQWESVGPSAGGYMWYPGISPRDPDLMLIACDMSGSYRSADGGRSWRIFRPPAGTFGMMRMYPAFHPADPRTIFWGNDAALLVSRDAGRTWKVAHRNGLRGLGRPPSAMAFDFDAPANAFLAHGQRPGWQAGSGSNELYRSRDGGRSWKRLPGFPASGAVVGIVVDRTSPPARRRVFVGTTRGVRVSTDGGEVWSAAGQGLPRSGLFSFAGGSDPKAGRTVLYASFVSRGVYVSSDGGGSWKSSPLPEGTACRELAVSDAVPEVAYVSTGKMNDAVRIYRTGDAGATWKAVQGGKNPDDPGWKFLQGPRASGRVNALAVSATDPSRIIVTDRSAAIVGERSGAVWRQVYCDPAPGGLWRGRGLEVTHALHVQFDPHNPRWVYASYNDQGLWISPDGGSSWDTRMRERMNDSGVTGYSNYAAALDPDRPGAVYAGVSLPNDLPRKRSGDTRGMKGSLGFSPDRGKTWRPLGKNRGSGLPDGPVTAIHVDPKSPRARRRLVAGVFGRGVYVSEDGGEKWRDSSLGLKGSRNVIHMTAGSQGRLYLCVLDGRGGTGGLYVSGDRGASWKALGAGRLLNVSDVTTDPRKPGRIFAACGENGSSPDGVWRSDDGGSTWKCVLERGKTHGVCVDPRPPHILYACVADWASGGLWASPDGGSTWKEIEGLPYHIINRVAADPKDPRLLWVITAGGGLLRGRPE